MPLLIERSQIAAREENQEGVRENISAGDALLVFSPRFYPSQEILPRNPARDTFSGLASVSGRRSAEIAFQTELKGSGAPGTPPKWGKLMKSCGFAEIIVPGVSVTYSPASSQIPSMTLARHMDGVVQTIWGARGTVRVRLTAGQPGMLEFEFSGADFAVEDDGLLTGVEYDTTIPPIFLSADFSIDSYAARVEKLLIDIGNRLELQTDINSASGYRAAVIVERNPVGTFDPEMTVVNEYDFFQRRQEGREMSLNSTIGTTPGNRVTLSAPRCRYLDIMESRRNEIATLDTDFELNMVTGDDEFSITIF
jgi:hypothetical protein